MAKDSVEQLRQYALDAPEAQISASHDFRFPRRELDSPASQAETPAGAQRRVGYIFRHKRDEDAAGWRGECG